MRAAAAGIEPVHAMPGGLKNLLLSAFLVINLSGCAGYYYSKSSGPVEKDLSAALLLVPKDEQKLWKPKEIEFYNDERALSSYQEQNTDPNDKRTKIYNDKTRWCGRTIWAGFPIPLWLPACRTYTELTFENGVPVSAREQYVKGSGFLCGPFVPLMGISKSPLPSGFCETIELVDPPVQPENPRVSRSRRR